MPKESILRKTNLEKKHTAFCIVYLLDYELLYASDLNSTFTSTESPSLRNLSNKPLP